MRVSKLWWVGGCIVLVILGAILLLCAWAFDLGLVDVFCESALGVTGTGNTVYVETIDMETNVQYFQSNDNGSTWKTASNIPQDMQDELSGFSPMPILACNPADTKICYRISSRQDKLTDLEQSTDGGQSWQQVSIPFRLSNNGGCYQSSPRSLTFVKSIKSNEAYILVVAVGTNGVLMLTPEGTWTQHTINKLNGLE